MGTYVTTKDKKLVQEELTKALEVLIENDVDLIIIEYFFYIQEMEWAIELCKSYGKPIAATMAIGPKGDRAGISAGECAVRMAKAGADIVGANCLFDPWIQLETLKKMKTALDIFNQTPFLMAQPNAYRCPDCGPFGWLSLPESSRKSDVDLSLWKNIEQKQERHTGKGSRVYWDQLTPCTGRPLSAALHRQPDPQIL